MNAVEKIEAAIQKLEELKAGTVGDGWQILDDGILIGVETTHHLEVIEPGLRITDAEAIVTLHRTIDAQLALLRDGAKLIAERSQLAHDMNRGMRSEQLGSAWIDPDKLWPADLQVLAFADAILGDAS